MTTRGVIGSVLFLDATAAEGDKVRYRTERVGFGSDAIYMPSDVVAPIDADGDVERKELWASAEGGRNILCIMPNGYTWRFRLEPGDTDITLQELHALNTPLEPAVSPTIENLVNDSTGAAVSTERARYASTTPSLGSDLLGYKATGTGATDQTARDKLVETVSIFDFIPKTHHADIRNGISTYDASASLAYAYGASPTVIVPNGTFYIEGITPPVQARTLFGPKSYIKGPASDSVLFLTSGSTGAFLVEGGIFSDFACLWQHTGNSALHTSVWRNLNIYNTLKCFDLSSSVGNLWESCAFGGGGGGEGNIDYALFFAGTGGGQTNINTLRNCRFFDWAQHAVHVADTAIVKIGLKLDSCWFEVDQAPVGGTGSSVYIGGTSKMVTICDCYFEGSGGADAHDIEIEQSVGGAIQQIIIERNTFATGEPTMTHRIRSTGNSSFTARDNHATLSTGMIFAAVDGGSGFHTKLDNNYLNAVGGGTYASRLYSRSGAQPVSWSTFPGSGFVSEASPPAQTIAGTLSATIVLPETAIPISSPGDETPSVLGIEILKIHGATTLITGLDDGVVKQQVILVAQAACTIDFNSTMRLPGGVDFVMGAGDTLIMQMFSAGVWTQVGRTDLTP